MEKRRVLGLDLGTNSLGWCLIEEDLQQTPMAVVALGSRIFPMALEDKTPVPKNHARRRARLARRRNQRLARRKARMRNYLISLGFLPQELATTDQPEILWNEMGRLENQGASDVYLLRKKALTQPLSLQALSKIWMNFAARRGFQSARKTRLGNLLEDPRAAEYLASLEAENPLEAEDAEEREAMAEIGFLKQCMAEAKAPSLGAFLADLPPKARRRGWRTDRNMYQREFSLIWQAQAPHHPALTPDVRTALYQIIFNQRPIRLDAGLRGDCSLEKNSKRAAKAWLQSQRFRYWIDIHNLAWIDPVTFEKVGLTPEQKHRLAQELEMRKTMSWGAIRKLLNPKSHLKFNLEEAKTKAKGLKGNTTACELRRLMPDWDTLSETQQNQLLTDLITIDSKKGLFNRLIDHWQLETHLAFKLCIDLQLEPGYLQYSRKAIKKIVPHLQQFPTDRPWTLDKAVAKAGYQQWDQGEKGNRPLLEPLKPIPNPIVNRSMHQLRKVVNAVIKTHGKPDVIRLEMARDLKISRKQKEQINKTRKRNEALHKEAEAAYETYRARHPDRGLSPQLSHTYQLKYRLWKEQNKVCVYQNKKIGMYQLFDHATEIDHIIPYSRCMDNSFTNKVVCFREANQAKSNQTPAEWLQHQPDRYEQVKQAVRHLPHAKRKRFFLQDSALERTWLNSQLNDTRYVSRQAKSYLEQLGCEVSVTKGHTTAMLRGAWGLNNLLSPDISGEKNREDHRHHAVDACVIALTTRRLYQKLCDNVRFYEASSQQTKAEALPLRKLFPKNTYMPDLRQLLKEKLQAMVVSHATMRKLSGALHEQTAYGLGIGEKDQTTVVYRIPLDESFKIAKAKKVVDATLAKALETHLAGGGGHPFVWQKGVSSDTVRHLRVTYSKTFNPDAYLKVSNASGLAMRYHVKGNNHHVEVLRHLPSKKVVCVFRTAHEVALRVHRGIDAAAYRADWRKALTEAKARPVVKLPMIQKDHGPDYEFLMALHSNDTVRVWVDDVWHYYRVQNLDATGDRLVLRHHCAATLSHNHQKIRKSIRRLVEDLSMQRVDVDPLGRLRHDQTNRGGGV